ncbi:MAG: hypothetical protein AAB472_03115 [Patescibacteria group bacterium]
MAKRTSVPPGMKEIPVPKGLFIGSTEERIENFIGACIRVYLAPSTTSMKEIDQEYEEFTAEERALLNLRDLLRQASFVDIAVWLFPDRIKKWVAHRRAHIANEMIQKASRLRVDIKCGRVRRPKHVNPGTIVVPTQ